MATEKSARRLGRGLDALLRGAPGRSAASNRGGSEYQTLRVSAIRNNPYQPRKKFSGSQLKELEDSIRSNGLLQPVTVRKAAKGDGFELIAGERRLRAAANLGWKEIPAIVRDVDDRALLSYALIENLQRSDLDPVEEAEGYSQLVHEFGLTQQAVADLVGKDRTTVANSLRVLNLPSAIRDMIREGKLTLGHAKPLLGLEKQEKMLSLAREIVTRGLTVREVERRLKNVPSKTRRVRKKAADGKTADHTGLERRLRRRFQTDITIASRGKGAGSLTMQFYSDEDLQRIVELMGIIFE